MNGCCDRHSKTRFYPKLHHPRLGGSVGCWTAVGARIQRSPDLAKGRTARVVIGRSKIGVVGDVENVGAQLQRYLFEGRVLDRGQIGVEEPGSAQNVLSRVSEGADMRSP